MMMAWEVRDGRLGRHDVERPVATEGSVLVRVSHAGICGTDLPKLARPAGFAVPAPWRPGHEIAGTDPAAVASSAPSYPPPSRTGPAPSAGF